MNLISTYTLPAIFMVVSTFILMFVANKIHIDDSNKILFIVFTEIIVNVLLILGISIF